MDWNKMTLMEQAAEIRAKAKDNESLPDRIMAERDPKTLMVLLNKHRLHWFAPGGATECQAAISQCRTVKQLQLLMVSWTKTMIESGRDTADHMEKAARAAGE